MENLKTNFVTQRLQSGNSEYHLFEKKQENEHEETHKPREETSAHLERELQGENQFIAFYNLRAARLVDGKKYEERALHTQCRIDKLQIKYEKAVARELQAKQKDEHKVAPAPNVLSESQLIDGMCVAVQRAHSLRILHRQIGVDAFCVVNAQVKLGKWDRAVFNFGSTSYKNGESHEFRDPTDWHEVSPEMTRTDSLTGGWRKYGFEYDMWCLGLAIFEIMYGCELASECDIADFTDQWLQDWIDRTPLEMENPLVYKTILKIVLTTDPVRRANSYTIKNICDGPQNDLFDRQMEIVKNVEDTHLYNKHKYPNCPDIKLMLSNYADDEQRTIETVKKIDLAKHRNRRLECRCSDCLLINKELSESKSHTTKTYCMLRLMIAHDGRLTDRPENILTIFDILAQRVMNSDKPAVYNLKNTSYATDEALLLVVQAVANRIHDFRISM